MIARNRPVEEIQLSINHGSSIVITDIGHDDKDMALAAGLSSEEELFVGELDVHPFATKRFSTVTGGAPWIFPHFCTTSL